MTRRELKKGERREREIEYIYSTDSIVVIIEKDMILILYNFYKYYFKNIILPFKYTHQYIYLSSRYRCIYILYNQQSYTIYIIYFIEISDIVLL